ncbi:DNA-3-methyladenine glycosylase 2 [Parachitinimonas caeni]|uniref:DNA-3-methyladenine glycosylase II n=1 Tax=Parachitinimonas caeni TaxID=3031301 RepID=A0ABT7DXE6_9NEIS|nr:DNA-3-methyladenine glycosylase 2 [Parachitinimonas caeni]MDK2124740.1 DNA-3-methyladenine glycosylase 2 [Parachitinimonas caeni]
MSEFRQRGLIAARMLCVMELTDAACYAAFLSHDRKFDGRFFIGVASTGVYCRPVCSVRTPKPENCSYYPSAAAAERQGFRPCLKCRPELAPGLAPVDAGGRYAKVAARLIESGFLADHNCPQLAARLGITDRHLRRIFAEQFGASPIEYAQSQRLLNAKRLLMDTDLPLLQVAHEAGFSSLRRFNEMFCDRYRLSPSEIRQRQQAGSALPASLQFRLAYRPPYDWDWMMNFMASRAMKGLETVEAGSYVRSLTIMQGGKAHPGWVRVTPEPTQSRVVVEVSAGLSPVVPEVLAQMRQLFDLDAEPQDIAEVLGELALPRPGLRLPGAVGGFEFAVRAVLEQQVSVKAAATLAGRLIERCGEVIETPFAGVCRLFPSAEAVAALPVEVLREIGLSRQRAHCLHTLASQQAQGLLRLDFVVDVEAAITRLTELPGIGIWTATYIAMRAWGWPDAFLATDLIIRQRFAGYKPIDIERHAERWRPWRSYAVLHLWQGTPIRLTEPGL